MWVGGVIAGFGIVGFVPSTVASIQLLREKDLFDSTISYRYVVKKFADLYILAVRQPKEVGIFSLLFCVLVIDGFIIQQNHMLVSLFSIPIVVMGFYVLICLICYAILTASTQQKDTNGKKYLYKVIILSPIVLWKESMKIVGGIGVLSVINALVPGSWCIMLPLGFIAGGTWLQKGLTEKGCME